MASVGATVDFYLTDNEYEKENNVLDCDENDYIF